MPTTDPRTPREWQRYVATLSGSRLRSVALAAASLDFVQQLQVEGYKPKEIDHIFRLFAKQFIDTEQEPPSRAPGAYINYAELAQSLGLR
ncbi:hypothetical protein N9917_03535 [Deltaproteobacteria bacterium]|nr:hypothetical protein [Deltaproteobacteria bacterium]